MSPFRSKSQVRKFGAMLNRGEISKATFDKWVKHTKGSLKKLPEKVKKNK